jgi:dephospho-CoA kinase
MKVVGVTGGIGSGKSVVCKAFSVLGIPVYDSDARAKDIMATDIAVIKAISQLLGNDAYSGGILNRAFISKRVFKDPELLLKLNAIVHPAVAHDFNSWASEQKNVPYVIREAAILFESGASKQTDVIISVVAPAALRIQRVMQRDGRDESQVRDIISKQMTDKERIIRSDFVIVNDDLQMVLPQVLEIHQEICGSDSLPPR